MTPPLSARGLTAVLLDIEGTTTPIAFVHDVLFGYVRTHLTSFLDAHAAAPEVRSAITLLEAERANERPGFESPAWTGRIEPYVLGLMERDKKSPGLKRLQGLIWEQGYQRGELRGEVFDDVPAAMRRWHQAGLTIAIYSSGSELAQRRLFQSTRHGDLTPLIGGFFDTGMGAKREPNSYRRIADALGPAPRDIVFISDVAAELVAAADAGMSTILSMRPGNEAQGVGGYVEVVSNFDRL